MSTLLGVVVGALATGIPTVTLAILQRRWAVKDAGATWKRERKDRIFEAKRSAHAIFTEALHKTQGIMILSYAPDGSPPLSERPDFLAGMNELMHLQARLLVYASRQATDAAVAAVMAMLEVANRRDPEQNDAQRRRAYRRARILYLHAMRLDLEIDDSDITLDDLKANYKALADVHAQQNA